jgi:leucyl-tRNA synthetase
MTLLFSGDWQEGGEFNDAALAGIVRFTHRVWGLITAPHVTDAGAERTGEFAGRLDDFTRRVADGYERFKIQYGDRGVDGDGDMAIPSVAD